MSISDFLSSSSSFGDSQLKSSRPASSFRGDTTSKLGSELSGLSTATRRQFPLAHGNRVTTHPFPSASQSSQTISRTLLHEEHMWGTNVSVVELENDIRSFFQNFKIKEEDVVPYYQQLIINLSESTRVVTFLNLDCQHLLLFNKNLYDTLVNYVENCIQIFDFIATEKFEEWCGLPYQIQVRPYNLSNEVPMRELNPSDINKLVSLRGMVIRVSPIIPDLNTAFFECSVCHYSIEVIPQRGRIIEPTFCENCSTDFSLQMIHNRCKFLDKQHIKLQEAPETIPDGQTPHTVVLVCLEEFKDVVQPGDRVTVTGMFQASSIRPNKNQRTIKSIFKTHIEVFHFKKTDGFRIRKETILDKDEYSNNVVDIHKTKEDLDIQTEKLKKLSELPNIYEVLTSSFSPGIWQHEDVKKGILCQLFGGVNKNLKEEGLGNSRGDINILLCGDPGTSKSQFLTHVNRVAPRGIYTSGKSSSSVGLTAFVSKDPVTKELVLESGALVLSDGGVCCIDEFDKMTENTRSVLHEAMEQQTISIAKAGIICTLNARTSILAAANPIGSSWNSKIPIVNNINLPPTLLSRFDLIYIIMDNPDPINDRKLARHITSMYSTNSIVQDIFLPTDLLTKYISYARENIHPIISDSAAGDLVQAYLDLRQFGGNRKTITATPRQLESLIRISEALAKMRFSLIVTSEDVKEGLRLIKTALCQAVTDPITGMVDMSIITTGLSESSRQRLFVLMDKLKEFLMTHRQNSPMKLRNVLLEYNQGSNELQMDQLKDICRTLMEERFLSYDVRHETISLL